MTPWIFDSLKAKWQHPRTLPFDTPAKLLLHRHADFRFPESLIEVLNRLRAVPLEIMLRNL